MTAKRRKVGRPKKAKGLRRPYLLRISLYPGGKDQCQRAAVDAESLSSWVREILNAEVMKPGSKPSPVAGVRTARSDQIQAFVRTSEIKAYRASAYAAGFSSVLVWAGDVLMAAVKRAKV